VDARTSIDLDGLASRDEAVRRAEPIRLETDSSIAESCGVLVSSDLVLHGADERHVDRFRRAGRWCENLAVVDARNELRVDAVQRIAIEEGIRRQHEIEA